MNIQLKVWVGNEALGISPDMPCIVQNSQERRVQKHRPDLMSSEIRNMWLPKIRSAKALNSQKKLRVLHTSQNTERGICFLKKKKKKGNEEVGCSAEILEEIVHGNKEICMPLRNSSTWSRDDHCDWLGETKWAIKREEYETYKSARSVVQKQVEELIVKEWKKIIQKAEREE